MAIFIDSSLRSEWQFECFSRPLSQIVTIINPQFILHK